MRTLDVTLARPFRIGDRFVVEPSLSAFNVLNFANFDGPGNQSQRGTERNRRIGERHHRRPDRITNRIGPGSGVFIRWAPRARSSSESGLLSSARHCLAR